MTTKIEDLRALKRAGDALDAAAALHKDGNGPDPLEGLGINIDAVSEVALARGRYGMLTLPKDDVALATMWVEGFAIAWKTFQERAANEAA